MSQIINVGTVPNDGTGDLLRNAFIIVNNNFEDIDITTDSLQEQIDAISVTGGLSSTTASGTDTYTATITGVASYVDGAAFLVRFTNGNTSAATLNINGLGAITLYRNNDGALIGGDIQNGGEMLCVYNSTINAFQCIGTSPNDIISYVTNADSVTITKGMPVYAFGGQGDRMTVKRAYNTSDATSGQTIGLVMSASIAAGQKGLIITQGLLSGLSTLPSSTFADGDTIYLGANPGTITNVKPHAPNHLVYLGVITTASNGSAGRMYVKPQNGYELDEIHNVQAQNPTLKDTLWYDDTVTPAQWKTASISTILGYTPASQAALAAKQNTITLTTTGLTGTSTFNGTTLNIPQYGYGTVKNVASISIVATGSDLSSTVADSTTNPIITLAVPNAGTAARGVVSTGAQSFSGLKTFTDNIVVNGININRGSNDGAANIAIGLDTLEKISGNQNTAVGYQAGTNSNATPLVVSFNTAFGYQAYGNGRANNNTAIGWQALFASAANNNSALGYSAGSLIGAGAQNTFIGAFAGGVAGQISTTANSTAIGYNSFTTKNNQVVLGNGLVEETVIRGTTLVDGGIFNAVDSLIVGGIVRATQYKIASLNTAPATATAVGTLGEIRVTAGFIYVCIATNVWVRAALSTWV